ncbi:hypothetical protein M2271_006159 [Streptomyces sp. LBL]|nr:hypothetical protein [Streptomyces sp. LBL]MDH6628327.1 hypothetical protein [Streptomyces sp. LBL]
MVVATTEPGSPSRAALALLAQAISEATTQAGPSSDPVRTRPRTDKT